MTNILGTSTFYDNPGELKRDNRTYIDQAIIMHKYRQWSAFPFMSAYSFVNSQRANIQNFLYPIVPLKHVSTSETLQRIMIRF